MSASFGSGCARSSHGTGSAWEVVGARFVRIKKNTYEEKDHTHMHTPFGVDTLTTRGIVVVAICVASRPLVKYE